MAKKKKTEEPEKPKIISFEFDSWDWPFGFTGNLAQDAFLDDLIGIAEEIDVSVEDRRKFMQALFKSLSLDLNEKKRVIDAYKTLSQYQFDALLDVFKEEREKFKELSEKHPDDIVKLNTKSVIEWAQVVDPKYGAARVVELIPKEQLYSENSLRIIYSIMDSITDKENFSIAIRIGNYVFEDTKKYMSAIKNDGDIRPRLEPIANLYIYSLINSQMKKYDDGPYKISDEIVRSIITKEKSNLYDIFVLYCWQRFGLGFYPEEHRGTITKTISEYPPELGSFVPYRGFLRGDKKDLIEEMLAVIQFNAGSDTIFNKTIDEKIDSLNEHGLSRYISFITYFFAVYFIITAKNILTENSPHGVNITKIYNKIISRLEKIGHEFKLKNAGTIKQFMFFIEDKEYTIKGENIDKNNSWWLLHSIRDRNGFDVRELHRIASQNSYIGKIEIYQICMICYAGTLWKVERSNFLKFREVQEMALFLFEGLHREVGIEFSSEERGKFWNYLTAPRSHSMDSEFQRMIENISDTGDE